MMMTTIAKAAVIITTTAMMIITTGTTSTIIIIPMTIIQISPQQTPKGPTRSWVLKAGYEDLGPERDVVFRRRLSWILPGGIARCKHGYQTVKSGGGNVDRRMRWLLLGGGRKSDIFDLRIKVEPGKCSVYASNVAFWEQYNRMREMRSSIVSFSLMH